MRSRLAKKVIKRPWRYSVGSWRSAVRKLGLTVIKKVVFREEWIELDKRMLTAARTKWTAWQDETLKGAFQGATS